MFIELTDSNGNIEKLKLGFSAINYEKGKEVVRLVPMEKYDEIVKRIK